MTQRKPSSMRPDVARPEKRRRKKCPRTARGWIESVEPGQEHQAIELFKLATEKRNARAFRIIWELMEGEDPEELPDST
jgi:hypothetical protein